ncbi:hypothetical protein Mapa_003848 [Marchantia paleacea]|nr:hypothetical protein Mapa_003848 [Marchantia paleacea]
MGRIRPSRHFSRLCRLVEHHRLQHTFRPAVQRICSLVFACHELWTQRSGWAVLQFKVSLSGFSRCLFQNVRDLSSWNSITGRIFHDSNSIFVNTMLQTLKTADALLIYTAALL